MGPAFALSVAVLDLVGIYFGTQMMLSCFQDKAEYPLLQKYRFVVTCQFVFQATILVANTVEARNGLENFEHENSPCDVISLARNSAIFFVICNGVAMCVIHYHPAVLNRELSPNQVMAPNLMAGFAISVAWSCFSCFCQDCASYAVFTRCIWLLLVAAVMFVAWRTLRYYSFGEHVISKASPSVKTWRPWICCDKKVVFLLASHVVMVVLLYLYCYQKLKETSKLHEEVIYLFTLNFAAGIVFPVCFRDFINSNYDDEQNCRETVMHQKC